MDFQVKRLCDLQILEIKTFMKNDPCNIYFYLIYFMFKEHILLSLLRDIYIS